MKKWFLLIFAPLAVSLCASCGKGQTDGSSAGPLDVRIDAGSMDSFNRSMEPFRKAFEKMPQSERDRTADALKYAAFDAYKKYPGRGGARTPESARAFNLFAIGTLDGKTVNGILAEYEGYKVSEADAPLFAEFEKFLEVQPEG